MKPDAEQGATPAHKTNDLGAEKEKKMNTEMKNETASLTKILDSIWKAGDKDECSIKHVWAGIAATVAGTPAWETRADLRAQWAQYVASGKSADFTFKPGESPYPTPWGEDGYWAEGNDANIDLAIAHGGDGVPNEFTGEVHIQWTEEFMLKKELQLAAKWKLVRGLLEEIGYEQFGVVVRQSKFMAGHIEGYLDDLTKAGCSDSLDAASFIAGLSPEMDEEITVDKDDKAHFTKWVAAHQEDSEWIGQEVMERASETMCFGCVVEETINEMIVDGDLLVRDDDHIALIQEKVMESMRGDFCCEHSALEHFGVYSALIFLREMAVNGWDGAHGDFDYGTFIKRFAEMPDHAFNFCFTNVMRGIIFHAETLVFMDMESD